MLRRTLALALVAPALPAVVAIAASPAATAATPVPSLQWGVSKYFDEHTSVHVLSDGATEDAAGVITWPNGTGTYDRATGAGTIEYDGKVAGSFAFSGATQYTITVSDPIVSVDADRNGTVSVVVEVVIPPGSTADQDSTPPTRVTAAEFTANRWISGEGDLGTQTAVPDFAGVLMPGSAEATELGIPDGQPLEGKAFNPSFLRGLLPAVRAIFYASGSSNDPKKAPATIVAQGIGTGVATEPEPDAFAGLQWEVSSAYDATMETHTLADGATEDDLGVVSFPYESGTYDAETGEASVAYSGSVSALDTEPLLPNPGLPFPLPGSDQTYDVATVTFADPVVTTDLDGNGTITALVSSSNPTGAGGIATTIDPARVEVATFAAGVDGWVDGTERGKIVRTPAVFSAALLDQVVDPAQGSFGTEATAAADSLPSVFTAAAPAAPLLTPATTVTTTATSAADGVTLEVDGTGFRGRTRAADTGVSVGLAPAGTRPDVTTEAGLAEFAAVTTVPTADVVEHAFSTTLTAPTARLGPDTTYAVYTWQAPTYSNPTQDTATPVAIDFVALGLAEPLVPAVVVTRESADDERITWTVAGTGFTAVTNPGDAGIYVGLAESGELPDVSVFDTSAFVPDAIAWVMPTQVVDHAFTVRITAQRADLDPDTDYSFYTWQAHRHSNTSQDTETPVETVDRQAGTFVSSTRHQSTYGARATFAVGLPDGATGTVTMRGLGPTRTATVTGATATFTISPAQAAGAYRPTLSYSGDERFTATSASTYFTIHRARPVLKITRSGPRRITVRLTGPASVPAPGSKVLVNGRSVPLRAGIARVTVGPRAERFVVRYRGSDSFAPIRRVVVKPRR